MMSKVYLGGMPYEADVNSLLENFPANELRPGVEITHREVERSISSKCLSLWRNCHSGIKKLFTQQQN
jgi:hypothetical protein